MSSGGQVRNHSKDGAVLLGELKTGEIMWREPVTRSLQNVSNGEARANAIEFRGPYGK